MRRISSYTHPVRIKDLTHETGYRHKLIWRLSRQYPEAKRISLAIRGDEERLTPEPGEVVYVMASSMENEPRAAVEQRHRQPSQPVKFPVAYTTLARRCVRCGKKRNHNAVRWSKSFRSKRYKVEIICAECGHHWRSPYREFEWNAPIDACKAESKAVQDYVRYLDAIIANKEREEREQLTPVNPDLIADFLDACRGLAPNGEWVSYRDVREAACMSHSYAKFVLEELEGKHLAVARPYRQVRLLDPRSLCDESTTSLQFAQPCKSLSVPWL